MATLNIGTDKMKYVDPSEITASRLSDGPEYVFIQPKEEYEYHGLTGKVEDKSVVVLLGERGGYDTLIRSECGGLGGAMIPNPVVRVDLSSAFDPGFRRLTGAVVREGDKLILMGVNRRNFGSRIRVIINEGLPHTDEPVGFSRWQLVNEENDEYIELFSTDVSGTSEAP